MSQGTALLWQGPCGHAAATARRCGPACECPARGSDLQGASGQGSQLSLAHRLGHGAGSCCEAARGPALGPAAISCAQLSPPVQGLKLPGSTRDADGEGDSGSPEARAPAQHSEYGGGLAAGSGWQGSLLCPIQQDRQLPTLQGSPVPCQSPEHCRAWNRSWALSQSSSWLMSPLKGAGWEQPGTCRGHPLPGTEELLPPGTARRGNLTALYKYRGVGACGQAI